MASRDLHELPRFGDGISYLYLEHCRLEQDDKSIASWSEEGVVHIPVAALATLLLGPGTVVTHAAMKTLAESGTSVIWVGENAVRTYACGTGETRHSRNLLRQAWLATHQQARLEVVSRMYCMRFPEPLPADLTLQQIRGMEGARVRDAYAAAAKQFGVEWRGRSYDRGKWDAADPVNRALSTANSCLYGLCHAAIVSLGYSPALGFIHTGKQLSFVYDIADLYKVEITIPVAFAMAAEGGQHLERQVRLTLRDRMSEARLLERIPGDMATALNVPLEEMDPYAEDFARPADLWEPQEGAEHKTLPSAGEGPF
jgi:CRISP-associated protein Cas1